MLRYRRAERPAGVVHFQWLPVQALDALLLPRVHPRLLTAHDVLPREPRPGQLAGQRRLYERMDAIVVHSEHGAGRLRDELGLDPARVHVIPHGALTALTEQPEDATPPPELAGARARGPVVLFFGLLRPYKGVDVLVEAWRRADRPAGAQLWIAGMPRMDVSGVHALDLRAAFRFVSASELAGAFRAADLVVLPYREIDQSGVLFTALAFGKPMILSAVGGFPEVAATGAADLVPPGDPDALAAALTALLGDPARRARMAAAARAAAAVPYGWDAIARRTLALYAALQP
jgi:glycosyltransferase involved in cell wall biosynthesis